MRKALRTTKLTDKTLLDSTLFNLSPDPVVILQDNKFVYASPAFLKTFGVSSEIIEKGLLIKDFLPPEDIEYVNQRYAERISGKKKLSDIFELRAYKPDGSLVYLEASSAAIEFKDRPAILSIVRDVTLITRTQAQLKATAEETAIAQKKLSEKENLHKLLINLSPDPITIIQDGKFVFASPSFFTIFGYTQKDIDAGLSYDRLLVQTDRAKVTERYNAKIKGETVPDFIYLEATKEDGSILSLEAKSTTINWLGNPAVMSIMRDITNQKKAELALRESEEHFKNIAEKSPNGIFISDGTRLVYANDQCSKTLGYSLQTLCSAKFDLMKPVAPESRNRIKNIVSQLFSNIDVPPFQQKFVTPNGRTINTILTPKLISYHGTPAILGIITDITELKNTQERLTEATRSLSSQKKELQDKNAALKEILAQIENERLQVRKQITRNIDQLLMPILDHLKKHSPESQYRYLDILDETLHDLTSEFGIQRQNDLSTLSPRQLEICNMIRNRMPSKEIADVLGVSIRTIEVHRNNIRKKLGLSKKDINLSTYLKKND